MPQRPPKTQQDAVDKFRGAIQKHDYETAATDLTGDYSEQTTLGTKVAGALHAGIGCLTKVMKTSGNSSDHAQYALRMLTPFPTEFEVAGGVIVSTRNRQTIRRCCGR